MLNTMQLPISRWFLGQVLTYRSSGCPSSGHWPVRKDGLSLQICTRARTTEALDCDGCTQAGNTSHRYKQERRAPPPASSICSTTEGTSEFVLEAGRTYFLGHCGPTMCVATLQLRSREKNNRVECNQRQSFHYPGWTIVNTLSFLLCCFSN